jgi:acyl phosphate:glycerol-3-phosphate acyltransferase
MTAFYIAITLVAAYLLGSIPTAYILGRVVKKTDIRQIGSRNMGAMNTFYSLGFKWGILVLAVDIGKGMLAMFLAEALKVPELVELIAGAVVVLGHNFPVFLKFHGGKGGATTIGVLVYLMKPWSFPIYGGLFALLFLITRVPTISYGLAFICFPFTAWLVYHRWEWIVFSAILLMIPIGRYIPRLKEMYKKAGGWSRVLKRKSVHDRF